MLSALWNITVTHALIAVGVAFALDAMTTYFALTHKGFVEMDPFTQMFITKVGLVAGLLVPRYCFLGVLYLLASHGFVWPATLLAFAVAFVGVAGWNLYQLHKGGAL